jgi:hypothetical protein
MIWGSFVGLLSLIGVAGLQGSADLMVRKARA